MQPHDEMRRLRACFGEAVGETAPTSGYIHGEPGHSAWITAGDAAVESRVHPAREDAVAELRAILRADADHAIADVLDTLAAEAERGPITAEMLRTMAAARRGA